MGKVYIVSDEFTAKIGLAGKMKESGFDAVEGSADLAAIAAAKPGIIVTDIDPGNENPLHFLEAIKASPELKGVEVFVYTGHIDVSLEVKLRRLKMSNLFTKDANLEFIINSTKSTFNPPVEEEYVDRMEEEAAPFRHAAVRAAPAQTAKSAEEIEKEQFNAMFSEFSGKVHQQLDKEGGGETFYNLGISYKDMGLHEQALKEFENAANDPQFRMEALSLAGVCLRQLNKFVEAIEKFKEGAKAATDPADAIGFRYEIGVTLQEMGKLKEAFNFLGAVYKADKGYRDVHARLVQLNSALKAEQK